MMVKTWKGEYANMSVTVMRQSQLTGKLMRKQGSVGEGDAIPIEHPMTVVRLYRSVRGYDWCEGGKELGSCCERFIHQQLHMKIFSP
jgi:hypothetical protein